MRSLSLRTPVIFLVVLLDFLPVSAHITPMIHLKKHNAAIKMMLQEGTSFYVKNVTLGRAEISKIKAMSGWTPDLERYKFYYGKDVAGKLVGDVLFISVNSKHGPLTLAIGFSPGNVITGVVLTDIPTEPFSWVRKLLQASFLDTFPGKSRDELGEIIDQISRKELGAMQRYYAKVIARGVQQAVVLQMVLYNL